MKPTPSPPLIPCRSELPDILGSREREKKEAKRVRSGEITRIWIVSSYGENESALHEEGLVVPALPTTLFTQSVGSGKDVRGTTGHGTLPNAIEPNRINHYAMYNSKEGVYHGVEAYVEVYAYFPVMENQLSSSLIWVVNGLGDNFNSIQVGWHIYPGLYGDNETHFFTYWTVDGYKNTGCYNLKCPGFVLESATIIKPGDVMKTANIGLKISQDPKTGDWWLYGYDRPVGHWPKKLFSTLANGASHVALGGMVSFLKNTSSPPMGNGRFPAAAESAALIQSIKFVDTNGGDQYPNADDFVAFQDATCYRVDAILDTRNHDGYFFYYGGPGHCAM